VSKLPVYGILKALLQAFSKLVNNFKRENLIFHQLNNKTIGACTKSTY
jgi:hypothetical protein